MNDTENPQRVEEGMVVTLDYTLQVDGEVVDSSKDGRPIQFIQGQEHIIPGLERELYGMRLGEEREVIIPPEAGYGPVEPEAGMDVPRREFPPEIPLEIGTEVQLRTRDGEIINARIDSIGPEIVRLDFNHPLAGKELHFNVRVIDLRMATEEEIEHGHVHDGEEDEE